MTITIHEPSKIVEVALTNAEQTDEAVKKQLNEVYARYKGTRYTVAVFFSGKRDLHEETRSLLLFLVQLAFSFFCGIIFFQFQNFGFALVWLAVLWALILWMLLSFLQVDCTAGWLQVPYLLWVTFAAYLNWGVWLLNPR